MELTKVLVLSLCCCIGSVSAQVCITPEIEQKARELVKRMTLEEKLDYISGPKSFYIRAIPRLNIPEIRMADGPQGVRNNTKSTMYPSGILSAATWNRQLIKQMGYSLGQDCKARGVSVILGPGVNIYRSPLCGRNFEYFGEDPYLTGEIAKQYILGVQDNNVIATIKHFAANNQEWSRHSVSSDVDERTLQEIYFPAFRKAVQEASVGAVMDSYNLVNCVHSTENKWMNIDVLRHQWGFKGILMSDWTSVYSAVGAANGGLDFEAPIGRFMNKENLLPAIKNGIVTEATIDLKVQHILQTLIAFHKLDEPAQDKTIPLDNPASASTALNVAREGLVLLKNEQNALPLKKGKTLVIGPNADVIPTGGGSGFVTPYSTVSVYEGMKKLLGKNKVELLPDSILYENICPHIYTDENLKTQGFKGTYFNTLEAKGTPFRETTEKDIRHSWKYKGPFEGMPDDKFSAYWIGFYKAPRNGTIKFHMAGDDGYRLFVNDSLTTGDWGNHGLSTRDAFINVEKGKVYKLRIEYFDNSGEATIHFLAGLLNENHLYASLKKADNVVICAGFNSSLESEGFDRPFALPAGQEFLIKEIARRHPNVTAVINAGGGVDFGKWDENIKAILLAWYPGQEGGQAIAETLTGKLSPSGKLPITIERRWEDNPTYNSYYDFRKVAQKRVQYNEGIFVGYRGYDRTKTQPLYPFGYGLSYSKFSYTNLKITKTGPTNITVEFDLKNTGKYNASETAQLYVHDAVCSVPRPLKELKGFEKTYLKAGETKHISIKLDKEAFAFYDVNSHSFIVEPGEFEIMVGSSSADLPLKGNVTL